MRRNTDRARKFVRFEKGFMLLLVLREDPFSGIAVRNVLLLTYVIHHLLTFEA